MGVLWNIVILLRSNYFVRHHLLLILVSFEVQLKVIDIDVK